MKCLKAELEHSEDEDLFIEAAQGIAHEAEMLAAVSHPNIVKLQGVIANRHDAFLDGASSFFIILERLERTLSDKIEVWAKEKNSFNPQRSLKSLSSSFTTGISGHSSSGALDKFEKDSGAEGDDAGSLDNRIRTASFLAGAVEYLHSQGIIFHDLKPDNVGFDMLGNLKLFDFGLARLMPEYGGAYEDLYEMNGAGTPRFSAPEVFFEKPYNLKADVYSFGVVLWEIMCLKKPFAKCKHRKEFEKALKRVDKVLAINRKWPRSIRDPIRRSLSGDHAERPTMREVCSVLNDCVLGLEDSEFENTDTTSTLTRSKRFVLPSRLSSKGVIRKFRSSLTSAVSATPIKNDHTYRRHLSETSGTGSTIGTFEDFLLQESEKKEQEHGQEQSLHSLQ
ncbi:MAP3K-like serine/threonine kinase [Skeletonema marinoi]|uniref:MAP3K-like serine/threonine kinase n=1 Tax=Skeletonema marinoi TaxID=267567 RepID=A0AAD8YCT9_9STRA|nr:MAP3K-like serine/threonine kinase [Skeletonema marinoi]